MENPFESGHIKNYILLYGSVVVIMILFFVAATLFNDVEDFEKKIFNTDVKENTVIEEVKEEDKKTMFKLLEVNSKNYSGYTKESK